MSARSPYTVCLGDIHDYHLFVHGWNEELTLYLIYRSYGVLIMAIKTFPVLECYESWKMAIGPSQICSLLLQLVYSIHEVALET